MLGTYYLANLITFEVFYEENYSSRYDGQSYVLSYCLRKRF